MKDVIARHGKIYESQREMLRRLDITATTFYRWRKKYGFVAALHVGNKKFYDRETIDNTVGDLVEPTKDKGGTI